MEILSHLMDGFGTSMMPLNLTVMVIGVTVGLFIGAMPGLGSVNGVAILLPLTFLVPPTSAIIFMAALYYGAMYGGAISSILLGIPGASTAVATTFDGRPMALNGKAGVALIAAAIASFVGGTVSIVLFTLLAEPLAELALKFGPAEEFALVLLAFTTFIGLGSDDKGKTVVSICLGLILSTVGLDMISGQPRLIFGDITGFFHGISFLVLAIGIYGIGEMLWTIESTRNKMSITTPKMTFGSFVETLRELRKTVGNMAQGSILGFFVGTLPAAGATPAAIMSYGIARSTSRNPERYGKGEINGIVAPEAANNAASTGSFLPMLTLGIPGSPTTALLLGGMVLWGLQPGPMLFLEQPEFVWGLLSSLYVSNAIALLVNLAFIPLFVWALKMPFTVLSAVIFVLCVVGGYAPSNDMHDVWLMLLFGLAGFVLRKLDYPLAPMVLAIVLGPLMEKALRQSLIASQGDMMVFVERPISATFILIAVLLFAAPLIKQLMSNRQPTDLTPKPLSEKKA